MAFMTFAILAMTGCSNDDNATEQPDVPERQDGIEVNHSILFVVPR